MKMIMGKKHQIVLSIVIMLFFVIWWELPLFQNPVHYFKSFDFFSNKSKTYPSTNKVIHMDNGATLLSCLQRDDDWRETAYYHFFTYSLSGVSETFGHELIKTKQPHPEPQFIITSNLVVVAMINWGIDDAVFIRTEQGIWHEHRFNTALLSRFFGDRRLTSFASHGRIQHLNLEGLIVEVDYEMDNLVRFSILEEGQLTLLRP